ncbi:MAG: hypothetical protein AAF799_17135 [Myxococcota bacterium]
MTALREFGMPPGLSVDDLARVEGSPPTGFRFGRRPFAVDLLTSVEGVEFDSAWAGSFVRTIDGVDVRVIGRTELLENQRATGHLKDAADVEALEAAESTESP